MLVLLFQLDIITKSFHRRHAGVYRPRTSAQCSPLGQNGIEEC